MKIIALAGPKTVGKTTVAKALADRINNSEHYANAHVLSFAEPIRKMIRGLGVPLKYYAVENKELPIEGLGKTLRELMQSLGTEWGRGMVSDRIWLWAMEEAIDYLKLLDSTDHIDGDCAPESVFIIDDCRFDNEAAWVTEQGGKVYELYRDGITYTKEHSSERGVNPKWIDVSVDVSVVKYAVQALEALNFSEA